MMNTDRLMAKYLEGTLTPEEQAEFQSQIDSSPELQEELKALKEIDKRLTEPFNINSKDIKFIDATYDKVAGSHFVSGASGNAVAGGSSTAGFTGFSSGLVATTLAVVGMAGILGYMIYNGTFNKDNKEAQPVTEQVINQVESTKQTDNQHKESILNPGNKNEQQPVIRKEEHPVAANQAKPTLAAKNDINTKDNKPSQTTATNIVKSDKEANAKAKAASESSTQNSSLIEAARNDLSIALSQNNYVRAASCYKQLGLLHKNTSSEVSAQNFAKSLELAQKVGDKTLEAECYGELALLDAQKGSSTAKDRANLCLKILENINSSKLNYWKKNLSRIK